MSEELKPCPFCGGKAYFERMGTSRQSCIVECGNCGVRHESSDEYGRSGMSWNERHEPAMTVPEGWKLAPIEPTERMVGVAIRTRDDYPDIHAGRKSYPYAATCNLYRKMLAVAPQAPEPEKERG